MSGLDDDGHWTAPPANIRFDLGPADEPRDQPETERREHAHKKPCGCVQAEPGSDCLHDIDRKYDVPAFRAAFDQWALDNPGYGVSWYAGPRAPKLEQFPRAQVGAA